MTMPDDVPSARRRVRGSCPLLAGSGGRGRAAAVTAPGGACHGEENADQISLVTLTFDHDRF